MKPFLERSRRISLFILAAGIAFSGRLNLYAADSSGTPPAKPNIIFILADDFSMDLLPYMIQSPTHGLEGMINEGTSFSNYFVSDSLCCPSRSSIFTGKFPHNTGVFTNTWDPKKGQLDGGFGAFNNNQNELHTFALALHQGQYETAMLGKYLNGYLPWDTEPYNKSRAWTTVWGWDEWDVAGNGYPEFIYDLNQNGAVKHYGIDPSDYLTDNLSRLAQAFLQSAKGPFFIEVATFAPHSPYRPAYRDETAYPGAAVPRTPAYDAIPDANAPDWMRDTPALAPQEMEAMDNEFRLRAQSVRAIDKLISDIRAGLKATGEDQNTYIFFSSDNGYHMGEYRFLPGKMTPFDTDIRVPLVVVGPGVPHQTIQAIAQNIDLSPTFTDLGGHSAPTEPDGKSLVPFLQGVKPPVWRTKALIEHHGPPDDPSDPDNEKNERASGNANPPNYEALRTDQYLYVEYDNNGSTLSEQGYYDVVKDPYELKNIFKSLPPSQQAALHSALQKMINCGQPGNPTCWQAQQ